MPVHFVSLDIDRHAFILDANFLIDLYSSRNEEHHISAQSFLAENNSVQMIVPPSSLSEAFYRIHQEMGLSIAHRMLLDIDTPGNLDMVATHKYPFLGVKSVSEKFGADLTDSDIANFVNEFRSEHDGTLLTIVTKDMRDFIPIGAAYKLMLYDYTKQSPVDLTK